MAWRWPGPGWRAADSQLFPACPGRCRLVHLSRSAACTCPSLSELNNGSSRAWQSTWQSTALNPRGRPDIRRTARRRRAIAVSGAPRAWEHRLVARLRLMAHLSGRGHRPLLTVGDRCGAMLRARRGHGRRVWLRACRGDDTNSRDSEAVQGDWSPVGKPSSEGAAVTSSSMLNL